MNPDPSNPQQTPPEGGLVHASAETRTAILDAAEQLFAELGVDGTSVRDITRLAGVNLGAINYHFGTKDRLAIEVFIRTLEPANQRRLARLDRLEKGAQGKPLELEVIMEALIRPMIENNADGVRTSDAFRQLTSRCFQEPNPEVKALVKERFRELCERFDAAISKALPHLSPNDIFWRTHYVHGAMHQALASWLRFDVLPMPDLPEGQRPKRLEVEEMIQHLVACSAAAFRAPCTKKLSEKNR